MRKTFTLFTFQKGDGKVNYFVFIINKKLNEYSDELNSATTGVSNTLKSKVPLVKRN